MSHIFLVRFYFHIFFHCYYLSQLKLHSHVPSPAAFSRLPPFLKPFSHFPSAVHPSSSARQIDVFPYNYYTQYALRQLSYLINSSLLCSIHFNCLFLILFMSSFSLFSLRLSRWLRPPYILYSVSFCKNTLALLYYSFMRELSTIH